jgi:hypothetical protein
MYLHDNYKLKMAKKKGSEVRAAASKAAYLFCRQPQQHAIFSLVQ